MKVLVLVDHAEGISGPHRNVVTSLNSLARRGDIDIVLLTNRIDKNESYYKSSSVEIQLGYSPHDPSKVISNIVNVIRASKDCNVIYVPTNFKSLMFAQVARFGKRLVAGPNVTAISGRRYDSPGWIELKWMCDLWIEASEVRRNHVVMISKDEQVRCIRHAIDCTAFCPQYRIERIWSDYDIPSSTVKLLYVGRDDEPRKGVAQLLNAFKVLRDSGMAENIDLILVGAMSQVTQRRIGDWDNAHDLGFQQGRALAQIQASSDIAVVPSSWENMPFVVLEAMASGVPVIASRTGGIPEQVVDGETGILVDMASPNGEFREDAHLRLANAISSLAVDSGRRKQLGSNARARAETEFSMTRLGDQLVECFSR